MHPFALNATQYGVYPTREQMLQYQRRALEHEIHTIEERHKREQRQHRRQSIMEQAQDVAALLNQVQNSRATLSSNQATPPLAPTSLPTLCEQQQATPVEWMLLKLAQQNEELHAMIRHSCSNTSPRLPDSTTSIRIEPVSSPVIASFPPSGSQTTIDDQGESPGLSIDSVVDVHQGLRPRTGPSSSPVRRWVTDDLPEIEWTDTDEELLEQLLREKSGTSDGNPNTPDGTAISTGDIAPGVLKRKQQDRLESRRKLAQLYDASSIVNSTGIRRPRWRIEQDTANGVVRPFTENGDGATTEPPMTAIQLFRSAVIAVLSVLELHRLLYEKRLRLRDKSIQDLEPMLNVYFDATRVWLGKLVKIPVLSIVQDPALDIDVSTKSGLFQASKDISKWFGKFRTTSATPIPTASTKGTPPAEHSKTVKLKVRVKGIVDAIVKAIDKGDIPSGMVEFWTRFTSDGIYFPSTYPLFPLEQLALDLDGLGATRSMQDDYTALSGQGYSRFVIVLANFMLLRVLIPHVVLRPWEIGLGTDNASKAVSTNLKNVATLLYAIIAHLSPLPPIPISAETDPSLRLGVRRRSVEVVPVTGTVDALSPSNTRSNNEEEDNTEAKRFMSITDIHQLLIPDKHVPLGRFKPFISDQHVRLRTALQVLQARLHPLPTNVREDASD